MRRKNEKGFGLDRSVDCRRPVVQELYVGQSQIPIDNLFASA